MESTYRRKSVVMFALCAMLACVGAAMLGGCVSVDAGQGAGEAKGITVSASSETKVVPDKARISVSVISEEDTAEACQAKNAQAVNAVIEALAKLGVEEKSIQTSYSNLSPRYGSRVSGKEAQVDDGEVAYDEWVITGYEMTTALSVSDLEIDNVGATVQACVAAGANRSDGVDYYASNYDAAYNEALSAALETARSKAESMAAACNVGLGKAVNVVEGYQDTSARYVQENKAMTMAEEDAAEGAVAPTMPGQVSIAANVTVTYAIA